MAPLLKRVSVELLLVGARLLNWVMGLAAWVYSWLPEAVRGKILLVAGRGLWLSAAFRMGVQTNLVRAYGGGSPERRDLRERLTRESGARRLRTLLENRTDRAPRVKGFAHWESLGSRRASAILVVSALGNPDRVFRWLKTDVPEASSAVLFGPKGTTAPLKSSAEIRVPFFGIPTSMTTAPVEFALVTGAAMVPVISYRGPQDGDLWIEFLPSLEWVAMLAEPELEVAVNTARLAGVLEEKIRAYPADWPWWMMRPDSNFSPLFDGEWRLPPAPRSFSLRSPSLFR